MAENDDRPPGGDGSAPGTQEMTAVSAGNDPAPPAAKVSATVIDEAEPARKDEAAPWAAAGKTQPGEPPIMDVAPAAFPAPPPQPAAPIMAPQPRPMPGPPVPMYAPPPPPMRRGGGGGGSLGLIIGGLLGVGAVIGIIALFVMFKPSSDEPVTPLEPISGGGTPVEVKPEIATPETTVETPMPEPDPEPAPPPVQPKPKPKPATTTAPTTQPTQTVPTTQPTPTNTLPPPPPPNTGSGTGGTGGGPKLKLPKRPR